METVSHGSLDYPFHFYYENMDMFDFNCIDWHWHVSVNLSVSYVQNQLLYNSNDQRRYI